MYVCINEMSDWEGGGWVGAGVGKNHMTNKLKVSTSDQNCTPMLKSAVGATPALYC